MRSARRRLSEFLERCEDRAGPLPAFVKGSSRGFAGWGGAPDALSIAPTIACSRAVAEWREAGEHVFRLDVRSAGSTSDARLRHLRHCSSLHA